MNAQFPASDHPLVFVHIGDLHLTTAKERNFADLLAVIAQIEIDCSSLIDFVVLPGDNADNGMPAQYQLAATALKMLSVPFYVIPGDHDREQGHLEAFYKGLSQEPLPRAMTCRGYRCLFVDIIGPGSGGPDFRFGHDQLSWLEKELTAADERAETSLIFMHTYPGDLKGDGETEALNRLIAVHDVALVDMGHTHYNELANNGRTVFAATRSTGQIEEGPVGYSIITLDRGCVGWRFKPLDESFPFVAITSPVDYRLRRESIDPAASLNDIRVIVFGHRPVESVTCRIGTGELLPMTLHKQSGLWTCQLPTLEHNLTEIIVRAVDQSGRVGQQTIHIAGPGYVAPLRRGDGSDADSIGAWPENGLLATQLGPNRNAKPPQI